MVFGEYLWLFVYWLVEKYGLKRIYYVKREKVFEELLLRDRENIVFFKFVFLVNLNFYNDYE